MGSGRQTRSDKTKWGAHADPQFDVDGGVGKRYTAPSHVFARLRPAYPGLWRAQPPPHHPLPHLLPAKGEGRLLSDPRTSASLRLSFGKIPEILPIPDLIAIQRQSFEWLITEGLRETFDEISPIEDFTGQMALTFGEHRFEEPEHSVEECRERDNTYSRKLHVQAEFQNRTTGEIKSQSVFMGDFPVMTDQGTFIINGTERVVTSQLVRSPGVIFEQEPDKTLDKLLTSCRVIPARGAWLEFDVDKKDTVGVRLDRKPRLPVTVLLRGLGMGDEQIRERFGVSETMMGTLEKDHTKTEEDALVEIYRRLRPGEPPSAESGRQLLHGLFFQPKRYDLAKVGRYKINKKLGLENEQHKASRSPPTTSWPPWTTWSGCTRATPRPAPTTRTTSATGGCARSASSSRTRSASACRGWSGSCASA